MKTRFFSAVLSAMMLATASVGITASAEENVQTTETVTEAPASESAAEIVSNALEEQSAESTMVDYFADDYYDTDGNASLIKSEKIIYNSEEMQFIAVTTKDGHVFYVLINYSAENGQDNVFFLNKVDDFDLYALLYAGEKDEDGNSTITPEQAAQAAENAHGRVPQDSNSEKSDETVKTTDNENQSAEEVPAKNSPMNMNSIYLIFGAIALIGIGAAGFMLSKKKSKSQSVSADEPDDDEEEIYIKEDEVCIKEDEEDFNFYDDNQDE